MLSMYFFAADLQVQVTALLGTVLVAGAAASRSAAKRKRAQVCSLLICVLAAHSIFLMPRLVTVVVSPKASICFLQDGVQLQYKVSKG